MGVFFIGQVYTWGQSGKIDVRNGDVIARQMQKAHPHLSFIGNQMIDRNSYKRKVLIMEHCLTLAKAYYDQDNYKQADRYSLLASEYFGELLGFVEKPKCVLGK